MFLKIRNACKLFTLRLELQQETNKNLKYLNKRFLCEIRFGLLISHTNRFRVYKQFK